MPEDPRVIRARAAHEASEKARREARAAANSAGWAERQVRDNEIRSMWADGCWTHLSLAEKLGFKETTVRNAVNRKA